MRFRSFPFHPGQTLDVAFDGGSALAGRESLRATLRLVEEAIETHGRGENRSTRLVCYRVYADERTFDTDRQGRRCRSRCPPTCPATGCSKRRRSIGRSRCEVRDARPGVDYVGTFLAPVYRPQTQ